MVQLTNKVMNFLLLVRENKGSITKDSQTMYGTVGYYMMIGYLKKNGFLEHDGNTDSNQKIWKLTQKGRKASELINNLRRVLNGEEIESDTPEQ